MSCPWNRVVSLNRVPERVPESSQSCQKVQGHDPGTRFRDTTRFVSLNRVPESSQSCQKVPRTRSRDTIQGHDTIVSLNKSCRVPKWSKIGPNIWTRFVSLRDTIKGHDRDTIRDTKIVSCPLIVSLKSRDTIFLEFVSLRLSQGHDSGTRHDRVPDKSMPGA